MDMAQTASESRQMGPIEQPYSQYSIHPSGNSKTVTIPRATRVESGTTVCLREGWYEDTIIYLKAVSLDAALDGLPGTETTMTTCEGETIHEHERCTLTVRGKGTDDKGLTIPATCETDQFAEKSEPMVVSGITENEFVYLKLIPQCLYEKVGSINIDEIVQTISRS